MRHARRSLRRIGMVLLVGATSAAIAVPSRADDPRESWLEGRTFEKKETFETGGRTVEAYAAKAEADDPAGVHRFLVIEGDTVERAYAARALSAEGEGMRVELAPYTSDVEAEHMSIEVAFAPPSADYATARRLVEDALAVDELWTVASDALDRAIGAAEPETRRPLALAATRALDRAYLAHPDHVGLLHDLLTSYQLLLPLEAGTDRGANISFLWRDRLRTYVRLLGTDDLATDAIGRTLSACGLAEGCCALAWIGADFATKNGHAYGEGVVALLATLGQDHQDLAGDERFQAPSGSFRLVTVHCPGEPTDGGVPFHRLSWLTFGGASGEIPTPVWYSLTCERTGERSRWALYGNVGGSRRLLHLFSGEPDPENVRLMVHGQVRAGIDLAAQK